MPNRFGRATEAEVQACLFQWSSYYPQLKFMFAIPNGGSRNVIEAKNLKRQGVKSGVPDIFLPLVQGACHGLFIEMKVEKNKISKNQKEWIEHLNKIGYKAVVCNGFEEAKKIILEYIGRVDC